MGENSAFLCLQQPCDEAIVWVRQQLAEIHLNVVRTFDLQIARHAHTSCPCPHHGFNQCDCQMVVLLIYGADHQPVSLVAHGNNGQTWFSVVDTPQQRANPRLETAIRQALANRITTPIMNPVSQSHAG